jgi:hypothetical protein
MPPFSASILKMAACSSETLVSACKTGRNHNPEGRYLNNHLHQDVKTYIYNLFVTYFESEVLVLHGLYQFVSPIMVYVLNWITACHSCLQSAEQFIVSGTASVV